MAHPLASAPVPEYRPRSSSGTHLTARRPDYDKRKSRDDLYLMTSTTDKQSFKTLHDPVRGTSPSRKFDGAVPVGNLRKGSLDFGNSSHLPLPHTVQDRVAIGMAFGSPSHPPQGYHKSPPGFTRSPLSGGALAPPGFNSNGNKTRTPTSGYMPSPPGFTRSSPTVRNVEKAQAPTSTTSTPALTSMSTPPVPAIELQEPQDDLSKGKPRKWGLFRSRSRKGKDAGFSPQVPQGAENFDPTKPGYAHPGGQIGRSDSVRTTPKHKPIVIRAQTEPAAAGERTHAKHPPVPTRAPPPPPHDKELNVQMMRQHYLQRLGGGTQQQSIQGRLLDVEIPDITMERYSIMFGDVLKPVRPPKSNETVSPKGLGILNTQVGQPSAQVSHTLNPKSQEMKREQERTRQGSGDARQTQRPHVSRTEQSPLELADPHSEELLRQSLVQSKPQERNEPPKLINSSHSDLKAQKARKPQKLQKLQISQDLSSSSLLTRRQASLRKLKNMEEKDLARGQLSELKPPRRASSPQMKSSPTFNLFPSPSRSTSPLPQSPRLRSQSHSHGMPVHGNDLRSTPKMQSNLRMPPVKNQADRKATPPIVPKDMKASVGQMGVVKVHSSPGKPVDGSKSSPRKGGDDVKTSPSKFRADKTPTSGGQRKHPLTSRFHKFTPEMDTKPIFGSPTSMDDPSSINTNKPLPQIGKNEVARDIITPPASTTSSMSGTPKKESVSPFSTEKPEGNGEDPDEKALREAVKASITRQISISREQREMLKPFQNSGRKNSYPTKVKPLTIEDVATGRDERLAVTKKATPVLITPGPDSDDDSSYFYRNRKSEMVILEGM